MRFVRELSEQETVELVEALEGWDDPAEVRRARAVRLSQKGWTVPQIADALDVCRRSVRNWFDWYEERGLEGLRTDPRSSRPPKADPSYRERLAETVQTPPREMGYGFSRWTLERLTLHMEKETGVSLNQSYLREVLIDMGFVYKRPRHDLSHRRDEETYQKKKAELEDLKKGALAEEPDYGLLFVDECEVHLNPPLTKTWAKRGEPARVPAAGRDEKVFVFGAWDYRADRLIWHTAESKNSGQFLELLERILQEGPGGQQWVLVLDNAPYHRSNKVKEFLADQSDRLTPFWLPSYSPELNLIERVWLYVKENVTNNYFFGELQVLLEATEQACEQLSSPTETVLHLEFKTGKNLPQAA